MWILSPKPEIEYYHYFRTGFPMSLPNCIFLPPTCYTASCGNHIFAFFIVLLHAISLVMMYELAFDWFLILYNCNHTTHTFFCSALCFWDSFMLMHTAVVHSVPLLTEVSCSIISHPFIVHFTVGGTSGLFPVFCSCA